MAMLFWKGQEMRLKKQGASKWRANGLLLLILWIAINLIFAPDQIISFLLLGCFVCAFVLKIPAGIASILTLYFIIPSDTVNYLFVASPVGKFPLYIVLFVIFIVIGAFSSDRLKRTIDRREFAIYAGLMMIVICQIICLLAFSENEILSNTVKFAFQTIGMLLLIKVNRIDERTVYRICIFIVCLAFVSIVEGGFEIFAGFNLYSIYGQGELSDWLEWMSVSGTSLWRTKSTFANPLIYSSAMVLSLTCVEYIRLYVKNTFIPIVLISVLAIGMLMGGSRSSIVILGVYLIYYVKNSNVNQKLLFIIGIFIAGIIICRYLDLSLILERFSEYNADNSMEHRFSAYGVFFEIFGKYFLFGCGLGNTYTILQKHISGNFSTNTFDNAFMDFGLGVGIIGMLAMIIIFKNVADICKDKECRLVKTAGMLAFALSFFLNITKYQSLWGVLWLFIALNMYMVPDECGEEVEYYERSKR